MPALRLLCVAAALALASAAPVQLPPFKGVLVTAQYRCDDFLCPDWELDVSRVDPAFREKLITKLAMLVPKSPVAAMSFPVYTAYHDPTRTFYTVGLPEQNGGTVWAVTVDAAVNTSTIISSARFEYPEGQGPIVRVHASANNTLYAIMAQGTLAVLDPRSGTITPVSSVVPPSAQGAQITSASVINTANDTLYTFIAGGSGPLVSTLDLRSNYITAATLTAKQEHWGLESLFQAVIRPKTGELLLLVAGRNGDEGFDQIASVDASSGAVTFVYNNLAESNLFFTCDPSTKSCDVLQTACFDAIEDRLYFQATQITSSDDVGTTVLMYADFAARQPYIDTGLNPFTFGYMGFHFVSVQA